MFSGKCYSVVSDDIRITTLASSEILDHSSDITTYVLEDVIDFGARRL